VEVYSKCGYRLDIIRFETRLNLHSKNERPEHSVSCRHCLCVKGGSTCKAEHNSISRHGMVMGCRGLSSKMVSKISSSSSPRKANRPSNISYVKKQNAHQSTVRPYRYSSRICLNVSSILRTTSTSGAINSGVLQNVLVVQLISWLHIS
jgi:hypothetical protein